MLKVLNIAGLGEFTFYDLRYCAINNLRFACNDCFVIKQASGHKTDGAFRRYNLVTVEGMKGMKWMVQKEEKTVKMDTYMVTCEQSNNDNPCKSLKS